MRSFKINFYFFKINLEVPEMLCNLVMSTDDNPQKSTQKNVSIMKAVVKEKKASQAYPFLGLYNDGEISYVVLFQSKSTGFVVQSTDYKIRKIGEYSESWATERFSLFTGTIELSND